MENLDWIDELVMEYELLGIDNPGTCEYCRQDVGLIIEAPSQTYYPWDGHGENPNRALLLCVDCAKGYTAIMDERWADYYSSIL